MQQIVRVVLFIWLSVGRNM